MVDDTDRGAVGSVTVSQVSPACPARRLRRPRTDTAISAVPEEVAGVSGAVHLALDEVFSPHSLARWLDRGSPVGGADPAKPELLNAST